MSTDASAVVVAAAAAVVNALLQHLSCHRPALLPLLLYSMDVWAAAEFKSCSFRQMQTGFSCAVLQYVYLNPVLQDPDTCQVSLKP